MNRADVNIMVDCIITLPQGYMGDEREFFKHCSKFIVERYGKDSYIGGWVHKDETQPHIHLAFVPRVYDEKKKRFKICAKEVLDKKELNSFHPDLESYLLDKGLVEKGMILSGVTKETGGNKTTKELKELTRKFEKWQKIVNDKVEKVEALLKRLERYIPEKDIKEIANILDEIKKNNETDVVKELEVTPKVERRKETNYVR